MEQLKEETIKFWEMGFSDTDIVEELRQFYDTNRYGLGYRSISLQGFMHSLYCFRIKKFRKLRSSWGLPSARARTLTAEEVEGKIMEMKERFPMAGARRIRNHMRLHKHVKVTE